jgi:hypothetical protein
MYGSQNKQRLLLCATFTDWFCITEVVSVYCTVVTDSLYKQIFSLVKGLSETVQYGLKLPEHDFTKLSFWFIIRFDHVPADICITVQPT